MKKNLKKATALLAVCGAVVAAPVATLLTSPAAVFAEDTASRTSGQEDGNNEQAKGDHQEPVEEGGAGASGDSGSSGTGKEDQSGGAGTGDTESGSGDAGSGTSGDEQKGSEDTPSGDTGTEEQPSGEEGGKGPSGDTDPTTEEPEAPPVPTESETGAETEAPSLNAAPQLTEGDGAVYVPGSGQGLTFRSTASFGSFTGVLVDGNKVSEDNYTKREGSIIIELKPAYLASLPAGDHTVTIESTEGNTTAGFKVAAADDSKAYTAATPKTGDATSIAVPAVTLAAAAAAAVFFVARRAKKN